MKAGWGGRRLRRRIYCFPLPFSTMHWRLRLCESRPPLGAGVQAALNACVKWPLFRQETKRLGKGREAPGGCLPASWRGSPPSRAPGAVRVNRPQGLALQKIRGTAAFGSQARQRPAPFVISLSQSRAGRRNPPPALPSPVQFFPRIQNHPARYRQVCRESSQARACFHPSGPARRILYPAVRADASGVASKNPNGSPHFYFRPKWSKMSTF